LNDALFALADDARRERYDRMLLGIDTPPEAAAKNAAGAAGPFPLHCGSPRARPPDAWKWKTESACPQAHCSAQHICKFGAQNWPESLCPRQCKIFAAQHGNSFFRLHSNPWTILMQIKNRVG
jgi:hypothetical protein